MGSYLIDNCYAAVGFAAANIADVSVVILIVDVLFLHTS